MFFFSPTWKKFEAKNSAWDQQLYLMDKDVKPEWRRAGYPALNEGRKMAVRFYWFCAELENGGLVQYFWNSSGEFAGGQAADFAAVGLSEAAAVLTQASIKLFGAESPPASSAERRSLMNQYYGTHPFNDDDDSERLGALRNRDTLDEETEQLRNRMLDMYVAYSTWCSAHARYFTRLK